MSIPNSKARHLEGQGFYLQGYVSSTIAIFKACFNPKTLVDGASLISVPTVHLLLL